MCLMFLSVHIKIDEKYAIVCFLVQFRKSMKVYVKTEKSSVFLRSCLCQRNRKWAQNPCGDVYDIVRERTRVSDRLGFAQVSL